MGATRSLSDAVMRLAAEHPGKFADWEESGLSLARVWEKALEALAKAGLGADGELGLLLESAWALGIASPTFEWTGFDGFLNAWGSPGYPLPRPDGADESPLVWLVEAVQLRIHPFCDVRAPERVGSFEFFPAEGWLRDQIIKTTVATLGHSKARAFTPLLMVAHRYASDPLTYAEVLDATRRCVELPNALSLIQRRRLRWLADQVYCHWLSVPEAGRFINEWFIDPMQSDELHKWRVAMIAR